MGRSLKKGPYIDEKLSERIEELNRTRQKKVLRTWARRSTIPPEIGRASCRERVLRLV